MDRAISYDEFSSLLDESLMKVNNLEATEADKDKY